MDQLFVETISTKLLFSPVVQAVLAEEEGKGLSKQRQLSSLMLAALEPHC